VVEKQKGVIALGKVVGRIVRVKGEELDIFVLLGDERIIRVPKVFVEEYGEVPLNLDQEVHLTINEDTLEKYVFYDVNN
jgi:hypothetical protein